MGLTICIIVNQIASITLYYYQKAVTVDGMVGVFNSFSMFGLHFSFFFAVYMSFERFAMFTHLSPTSYLYRGIKGVVVYMFFGSVAAVITIVYHQVTLQGTIINAVSTDAGTVLLLLGNLHALIVIIADFTLNLTMIRRTLKNQAELARVSKSSQSSKLRRITRMSTMFCVLLMIDLVIGAVQLLGNYLIKNSGDEQILGKQTSIGAR
jgi:hypothetical protein